MEKESRDGEARRETRPRRVGVSGARRAAARAAASHAADDGVRAASSERPPRCCLHSIQIGVLTWCAADSGRRNRADAARELPSSTREPPRPTHSRACRQNACLAAITCRISHQSENAGTAAAARLRVSAVSKLHCDRCWRNEAARPSWARDAPSSELACPSSRRCILLLLLLLLLQSSPKPLCWALCWVSPL